MIKSIQTLQSKAARAVTKLDWNTPTKEVLRQCGWLSVNQLSAISHSGPGVQGPAGQVPQISLQHVLNHLQLKHQGGRQWEDQEHKEARA